MSAIPPRVRGILIIICIFVVSLAITPALSDRDLYWAGTFFTVGETHSGWILGREAPWRQLYQYGEIPPLVFAFFALVAYAASKLGKMNEKYAKPCMVVILTVVIGPGLLVNCVLKEYWGRPRPADIVAFDGTANYREVWQPGGKGKGKSFTCGHGALAFSIASGAAFYNLHPALAIGSVVAGVSYGVLMSVARMIQGGHFATDTLWSGAIVFMVLAGLYYLVLRVPEQFISKPSSKIE
jgi:lipid A 4'-phosphatase